MATIAAAIHTTPGVTANCGVSRVTGLPLSSQSHNALQHRYSTRLTAVAKLIVQILKFHIHA